MMFVELFKKIKAVFSSPVADVKQQIETTKGIFFLLCECVTNWGQSIIKKVFYGAKAIYNCVVYIGCEIGKHKYSMYVTVLEFAKKVFNYTLDFCVKYNTQLQFALDKLAKGLGLYLVFRMLVLMACYVAPSLCEAIHGSEEVSFYKHGTVM